MVKFVQRFVAQLTSIHAKISAFSCKLRSYIFPINLYVRPTRNQRFGFAIRLYQEFAYQRVTMGFDNSSIRAIIRDEDFLNGHQRRPQCHPF